MKKMLIALIAVSFLIVTVPAFCDTGFTPEIQKILSDMASGKKVEHGGPLGHGTGIYRIGEKEIPFVWFSYTNSDGWLQIALNVRVYGFDRRPINEFRDQLGRRGIWEARTFGKMTWIGMSNDFVVRDDLDKKYSHAGEWTVFPNGRGRSAPVFWHYAPLKRDYLDRITMATSGGLTFKVAELGEQ